MELLLLEDSARELAVHLGALQTRGEWHAWRAQFNHTLAALRGVLPNCPAKRRLVAACREAAALP